jgi:hypothetical protein
MGSFSEKIKMVSQKFVIGFLVQEGSESSDIHMIPCQKHSASQDVSQLCEH